MAPAQAGASFFLDLHDLHDLHDVLDGRERLERRAGWIRPWRC